MTLQKFNIKELDYREVFKHSQQLKEYEIARIDFYRNSDYFYIYKFSTLEECRDKCERLFFHFQCQSKKILMDNVLQQSLYDSKYIIESNNLIEYLKDIILNKNFNKLLHFIVNLQFLTLDPYYSVPNKDIFINLLKDLILIFIENSYSETFFVNLNLCLNQVIVSIEKHMYVRFYCINLFEQLLPPGEQKFE